MNKCLRYLFFHFHFLVFDRMLIDMFYIHKDINLSNETTAVILFCWEIPLKVHDIMNNDVKKKKDCKCSLKCFHKHIKTLKHRGTRNWWKCILRWHLSKQVKLRGEEAMYMQHVAYWKCSCKFIQSSKGGELDHATQTSPMKVYPI